MIDTHCHILPMCDDGSSEWAESMEMARRAAAKGITDIIATPHHGKGNYHNTPDKIKTLVRQLNDRLAKENIPLTVWAGQEFHCDLKSGRSMGFNRLQLLGDSRYALIELPAHKTPPNGIAFVRQLRASDITPIVAHPERHIPFVRKPSKMLEWMQAGAVFQLTAPSLTGQYGTEVYQAALTMAKNGWVHLLGSDAHGQSRRACELEIAFRVLATEVGAGFAKKIQNNAEELLRGKQSEVEHKTSD